MTERDRARPFVLALILVIIGLLLAPDLSSSPAPVAEAAPRPTRTPTHTRTPTAPLPTATATTAPADTPTSTSTPAATNTAAATSTPTATPTATGVVAPPGGVVIDTNTMVFDSDRSGNFEIYTMVVNPSPIRESITRLTNDATYDSWWGRISPNRQSILFYRTPKGVHDTDYTMTSLWVMRADGTGARELRAPGRDGWAHQGHGEWVSTAEGVQIVTFGGSATNPQIYLLNATDGSAIRQITNRGGVSLDPSWSQGDPNNILFIGCPVAYCLPSNYEVYRVALSADRSTTATRLTDNSKRDHDPYTSNLGGLIAWTQQTDTTSNGGAGAWNIWVMNHNGAGQFNLTNDTAISTVPQWSWSPDDRWIYFHRVAAPANRFGIYRASPVAGARIEPVLVDDGWNNEYPSL